MPPLAEKQAALRVKNARLREQARPAARRQAEQERAERGAFQKMRIYLQRQAEELAEERRVTAFYGVKTTAMYLEERSHYEVVHIRDNELAHIRQELRRVGSMRYTYAPV